MYEEELDTCSPLTRCRLWGGPTAERLPVIGRSSLWIWSNVTPSSTSAWFKHKRSRRIVSAASFFLGSYPNFDLISTLSVERRRKIIEKVVLALSGSWVKSLPGRFSEKSLLWLVVLYSMTV